MSTFCALSLTDLEEHCFCASFINNYGFSTNARFSRDYHPFMLARCKDNFIALEKALVHANIAIHGRIMICGYQENAIARYVTRYDDCMIDDEHSLHTSQGWDFATGNLFGYATGYLLQDLPGYIHDGCGEHLGCERVELFQSGTSLLQRHAFGTAYQVLVNARQRMRTLLHNNALSEALSLLHDTWAYLYVHGVRDGSGNVIATQNILFSLYYVRHLLSSSVPIKKLFTGPDITYPIQVVPCQKKNDSYGAQTFVQRFVQELVPIDNKKTAYIACSFVDGVGKTTLLSNVRNWLKYGTAFQQYEAVDNSSSQALTIHRMSDNVIMIDTPALISHLMIKPDGGVFVDCATVARCTSTYLTKVRMHAQKYKEQYKQSFVELVNKVYAQNKTKDTDDLIELYARKVVLLGNDIAWIPFVYNNDLFLISAYNNHDLRMLVPLSQAHSSGLKERNPTFMLFYDGVRFPQSYDTFLSDLIAVLQDNNIERVVLLDCMGMYPCTSRETVRLNFILQQLQECIGSSKDFQNNIYCCATTPHDLYRSLMFNYTALHEQLKAETLMRWGLYELLIMCADQGVAQCSLEHIQRLLPTVCRELNDTHEVLIHGLIQHKLSLEKDELDTSLGRDKYFQGVTCFSVDSLVQLGESLCAFWKTMTDDPYGLYWHGMDEPLDETSLGSSPHPNSIRLQSGELVEVVYAVHHSCHDAVIIQELATLIRTHWYTACARLLCPNYVVLPPLVIKRASNGICYCVRRYLPKYTGRVDAQSPWIDTADDHSYVGTRTVPCCTDWQQTITYRQAYAFGYDPSDTASAMTMLINTMLQQRHTHDKQTCLGITTSELVQAIHNTHIWNALVPSRSGHTMQPLPPVKIQQARFAVRALATLDMLIPSLSGDILVRKNSHKDFAAAIMLHERITLPRYGDWHFGGSLFEDYAKVTPLVEVTQ